MKLDFPLMKNSRQKTIIHWHLVKLYIAEYEITFFGSLLRPASHHNNFKSLQRQRVGHLNDISVVTYSSHFVAERWSHYNSYKKRDGTSTVSF